MVGAGEAVTSNLLCLRPGADAARQYESLFLQPEVGRWIRPEPMQPFTRRDLQRMAQRDRAHWDRYGFGPWAVGEREGGFVGRGGLAWATVDGEREVELPWAVLPELQGAGYATEMGLAAVDAARQLGLERVVSLTLPDNFASRRVMEKVGLELVGEIQHVGLPHVLYRLDLENG